MKVLVDLDFSCLTSGEKISGKMAKSPTVFDRIYAPALPAAWDFGKENRLRIMRALSGTCQQPRLRGEPGETVSSTMVRFPLCVWKWNLQGEPLFSMVGTKAGSKVFWQMVSLHQLQSRKH